MRVLLQSVLPVLSSLPSGSVLRCVWRASTRRSLPGDWTSCSSRVVYPHLHRLPQSQKVRSLVLF